MFLYYILWLDFLHKQRSLVAEFRHNIVFFFFLYAQKNVSLRIARHFRFQRNAKRSFHKGIYGCHYTVYYVKANEAKVRKDQEIRKQWVQKLLQI